jgi:hypothetical protein
MPDEIDDFVAIKSKKVLTIKELNDFTPTYKIKTFNFVSILINQGKLIIQLPKVHYALRQYPDNHYIDIQIQSESVITFLDRLDQMNRKYVDTHKLLEYENILKPYNKLRIKIKFIDQISIFDESGKEIDFDTFKTIKNCGIIPIIECTGLFSCQKTYCTWNILSMKVCSLDSLDKRQKVSKFTADDFRCDDEE